MMIKHRTPATTGQLADVDTHASVAASNCNKQIGSQSEQSNALTTILFNPLFSTLIAYVLDRPLFELYMYGPSLGGYGFHEGKQPSLICAEYTGVPEAHWLQSQNQLECEKLIMRKYNALLVCLHFALYLVTLVAFAWSCCGCAVFCCCCCRWRHGRHKSPESRQVCYRCAFRRSYANMLDRYSFTSLATSSQSSPSSSSSPSNPSSPS